MYKHSRDNVQPVPDDIKGIYQAVSAGDKHTVAIRTSKGFFQIEQTVVGSDGKRYQVLMAPDADNKFRFLVPEDSYRPVSQ